MVVGLRYGYKCLSVWCCRVWMGEVNMFRLGDVAKERDSGVVDGIGVLTWAFSG